MFVSRIEAVLKGIACGNRLDECAGAPISRLQRPQRIVNDAVVKPIQLPAKGESGHLAGQMAEDLLFACQENLFEPLRSFVDFARGQGPFGIERLTVKGLPPSAQHIVVLETKTQRIHPVMTSRAVSLKPVQFELLTQGQSIDNDRPLVQRWHVRGRRRDAFAEKRLDHPPPAQHRTGAQRIRGYGMHGRHAQETAAAAIRKLDPLKPLSRDTCNPIKLSESMVDVRVTAVDQFQK